MQSGSLYNAGMRPLSYSQHAADTARRGCVVDDVMTTHRLRWRRCGTSIRYVKTDQVHASSTRERVRYLHHFSWTHVFDADRDTVYFAQCYPYTYTGPPYTFHLSHHAAQTCRRT